MAIIGIDLGTTNSLVVAYIDGKEVLIPNEFNEYLTPSVVSVNENNEIIVGKLAKERLVTNSDLTTSLFKRNMGTNIITKLGKYQFLPEELSSYIVMQLIEDAKKFLNEDIEEVVISVPAYFNNRQRSATKKIGNILGIKVERLINEPSAAALEVHDFDKDETFIVFDFGGGTLDVTVVDCFDNVTNICSIAGDNNLGGSDFDYQIALDICKENGINYDNLNKVDKEAVLFQSEKIKHQLQNINELTTNIMINNKEYSYNITREKLYNISSVIFSRIKRIITQAVNTSGFDADEFESLVLVGGSCHMPIVQEYLTDLIKIPIANVENRDCSVALGLAKYIGIKQRDTNIKDLVLTDICPFSLNTSTLNSEDVSNPISTVMIPKNSVLPFVKNSFFQASTVEQKTIRIDVTQGEGYYSKDNLLLGETIIPLPSNKTNTPHSIRITYIYDINSILCVEVYIEANKKKYTYYIDDNNKLSEIDSSVVKNIKSNALILSKNDEIDLVMEKFNRLFLTLSLDYHEHLENLVSRFNSQIKLYHNNLRKKAILINNINNHLDYLEEESLKSDIFKTEFELEDIFVDDDIVDSQYKH